MYLAIHYHSPASGAYTKYWKVESNFQRACAHYRNQLWLTETGTQVLGMSFIPRKPKHAIIEGVIRGQVS